MNVDANVIDAATAVRIADWCVCEIIRLTYTISLEEAQAICDSVATRQIPFVWEVLGKKRVLDHKLSYPDQTLLLLYSSPDFAVPAEDLFVWTEHSKGSAYKSDVLSRLHRSRFVEYDRESEMVVISPLGIARVEADLLPVDSGG